jgi:plastocyanin
MPRFPALLAVTAATAIVALYAGCSDAGRISQPDAAASASRSGGAGSDESVRRIEMHDACDPTTFNAVLGAGTCLRSGGVTFDQFIGQLTKNGSIGAWNFAPSNLEAKVGQTLLAINRGGEEHTFTEVEEFGGGIVPVLNTLSGNTEVAPECQALAPDDFIKPGESDSDDEVEEPGTEKYQCCIHPWMRTTVTAKS